MVHPRPERRWESEGHRPQGMSAANCVPAQAHRDGRVDHRVGPHTLPFMPPADLPRIAESAMVRAASGQQQLFLASASL